MIMCVVAMMILVVVVVCYSSYYMKRGRHSINARNDSIFFVIIFSPPPPPPLLTQQTGGGTKIPLKKLKLTKRCRSRSLFLVSKVGSKIRITHDNAFDLNLNSDRHSDVRCETIIVNGKIGCIKSHHFGTYA